MNLNLNPADDAIFNEIYPLIDEIEQRLDHGISLALWVNLSRKLASRQVELEQMQDLLIRSYKHQQEYNTRMLN